MSILLVILIFIFGFINLFFLVVVAAYGSFNELMKWITFDEELNIVGKIIIFIICSPAIILVGVPLLICKGIAFIFTWHPKKKH